MQNWKKNIYRTFIISFFVLSQLSSSAFKAKNSIIICSWNLKDFGQGKTSSAISFIASTVKDFDVLLIQEVVAGDGGARAVARLAEELNRTGQKWDYVISDVTSGENSYKRERYAFIWKPSKVTIVGKPWLEKDYHVEIDREPFFCTFSNSGKLFTLVNFHAITKKSQPETEIKYFKFLPKEYPNHNLLFCGDFNLPQSHSVFNPLKKMGYNPVLINQKTSLRQKCIKVDCLASEFDNIFFKKENISYLKSGIIPFYTAFTDLSDARAVSDHVPIYFEFSLN